MSASADLPRLEDLDLSRRGSRPTRAFVRVDYNVPLEDGRVADDLRIRESARTVEWLLRHDVTVVLCSHLGRPGGKPVPELSLTPLVGPLSDLFGRRVSLTPLPPAPEAQAAVEAAGPGGIVLLENVRFDPREEAGDDRFATELASLADVYVNEAFSASHRAHASVTGLPRLLPGAAGFGLVHEVKMLSRLFDPPERPYVAVLGGAKVKDKLGVVEALVSKVDVLCVGGGMANTFLAAQGHGVGAARVEEDRFEGVLRALDAADRAGKKVLLPTDLVVAEAMEPEAYRRVVAVGEVPEGWIPLDIGPSTAEEFGRAVSSAGTVFWNGPMGVFEWEPFAKGTFAIAEAVASCDGFTVAGGGDTAAALKASGHSADVKHLSTGGGASLEFVRDEDLVGLAALRQSARSRQTTTAGEERA